MSKPQVFQSFLPNKGLVLNKPEEFLKNQFSSENSRNMEFYNEFLQGRLGIQKFDTTALNGAILLMEQFWKWDATWFLMVATTKDIYYYDFSNLRFVILTPTYTTGTITISAGTPTIVTGAGGANFTTAGIKVGDWIKIGAGNIHTGSTWYEVLTKDSDTQLTLKTAAAACSGSAYVIRKTFTGTSKDFWKSAAFNDSSLGVVWLATNGIDTPIKWTGTGQVSNISPLPTGMTAAKFIGVFKDRVMFAWTVEGGQNQPQRERWSAVANCQSYDDLDFHDFMEDGYWITGIVNFSDYHIIFRERDAFIGRFVGGDYIFDYEKSNSCIGNWGYNSIVALYSDIYYYGADNKFHRWNMLRDEVISEAIFPYTKDFDPNMDTYIFGFNVEVKNQIRWFVPHGSTSYNNVAIVYDYEQNIIQIWEHEQAQALCCIGDFINTSDLYADDPIFGEYYADELEVFFDDRQFLSAAPITIYGGYDGYIRKADLGIDDDGVAYNRIFESNRMNFGMPFENKRLWQQQFWLNSEIAGSITVKLKKDDSNSWEALTNTISLINSVRDIIKKNITWNKQAQNFKVRIESTNHFALLGFSSVVMRKGKTFN